MQPGLQLAELTRVLDGDRCLGRKGFDQGDFFRGERLDLVAIDQDDADAFLARNQGDRQCRPGPQHVGEGADIRLTSLVEFGFTHIVDVDRPLFPNGSGPHARLIQRHTGSDKRLVGIGDMTFARRRHKLGAIFRDKR